MEYGYREGPYAVPDMVRQFVEYFYRHIRERNVREIGSMYRHSFAKLSERFFQTSPWPPVEAIADFVEGDHVFCLLYKELYFRHLYAVSQPTLQQRVESWDTYRALFNIILSGNVNMQLPNEWLWEMVDEFIYQFQSFCQYRGKLSHKSPEEIAPLKANLDAWDPDTVVQYLQGLVDKSGIVKELTAEGGAQWLFETEGLQPKQSNVLRMLGYYSLVGLSVVNVLLARYEEALQCIYPLHPFERKYLCTAKITMCNITFFYYTAFAYLSLGRYLDAAKLYTHILAYILRVKSLHQGRREYDIILKKNEQMYRLLAITLVLAPAANKFLDENVANLLREKCGESMTKMVRGDIAVFDEMFSYACPKFVTAAPPTFETPPVDSNQNCYRQQLRMFLAMIEQQKQLPTLKQYLKLYSSISLAKLSSLTGMDEDTVRQDLDLLQRVSYCKTWVKGAPLDGVPQLCSEMEFSISQEEGQDMVIVSEAKPVRKQNDFLVRHIIKFEEIVRDLNLPLAPTRTAAY